MSCAFIKHTTRHTGPITFKSVSTRLKVEAEFCFCDSPTNLHDSLKVSCVFFFSRLVLH